MAHKIDRQNLGEGVFKIFKDGDPASSKPAYFYHPLLNVSSVPIYRGGIEKLSISWPKYFWQRATVTKIAKSEDVKLPPRKVSIFETWRLKKLYYPSDWNILDSVIRSFDVYMKKHGVEPRSMEEPSAFVEFKKRIQDPYLRFQLEFRLGYLEWPNEIDKSKVLCSDHTSVCPD